jgi:hypothetical protein
MGSRRLVATRRLTASQICDILHFAFVKKRRQNFCPKSKIRFFVILRSEATKNLQKRHEILRLRFASAQNDIYRINFVQIEISRKVDQDSILATLMPN